MVVDVSVLVQVEQAEGLVDLFALLFAEGFEELGGGCFAAFALEAVEALGFEARGFALLVGLRLLGLREGGLLVLVLLLLLLLLREGGWVV